MCRPGCHRNREPIFTRMKNIRTICVITIALALCGCANQLPPPGGPPDTTPPEILSTAPQARTLNFRDNSVVLEFSEYVDRTRAQENIFISPPVKTEYDWSGRELEIEFTEELQPQTTYAVTVGTEYADRTGNKPTEAYTLIFSTGDRLDSGVIRGIVNAESGDPAGAFVFLYPLSGIQADTLNPATTKPKYRTQTGANGTFEFQALPAGSYRLLAIRDEFRNEVFDPGTDAFGTTTEDVTIQDGGTAQVFFRLGPSTDITPPQVYGVTAVSQRFLRVEFSESLDTTSVQPASFTVEPEQGGPALPVQAAWLSPVRRFTAVVLLAETPAAGTWKLTATAVRDSAGNTMADTARTATFTASDLPDTTAPALLTAPLADSATGIDPKRSYAFVWSAAVDSQSVYGSTRLLRTADSTALPFDLRVPDDHVTEVVPRQPLSADTEYLLQLDGRGVRSVTGSAVADTVVRLRFRTTDPGDYGIMSGMVVDSAGAACPYVILLTSENKKTVFRAVLEAPGAWEFQEVPPGTYTLTAFCDADRNGMYSYGEAFPYRSAERFVVYQQPIVVRPRWTVDNVTILFR